MPSPDLHLFRLRYADFAVRHSFISKLRIVLLLGFWLLAAFFYPAILTSEEPIVLMVSLTFAFTTFCYLMINRGKNPTLWFGLELANDVLAQTMIVYMTGGPYSKYFTIYLFYCMAGGLFFNYRAALFMAFLIVSFYLGLLGLSIAEVLPAYSLPIGEIRFMGGHAEGPYQNFVLLVIFLAVAIYGLKIANHFTQMRERVLEERNRELSAMNRVSSTLRGTVSKSSVMSEILDAVTSGLNFEAIVLFHLEPERERMRLYVQEDNPLSRIAESFLNYSLKDVTLPVSSENLVFQSMEENRPVIRYELSELAGGLDPPMSTEQMRDLQRKLDLRKFVAVPLVAEEKVVGALIGMTKRSWVDDEEVRSLEGFANQAALAVENITLIEELRHKNVELERVSQVKSEFLATMSHELRTPLTAIIGFSELLLEEVMGPANEEQKESLREVLNNGQSLLHLINGLLDMAKIESGKMTVDCDPVSLPGMVEQVVRTIGSLLQKKDLKLDVEVPSDFPLLYVDERKLQQVLLNLLSNAIKFTPEQGAIGVVAAYHPDASGLPEESGLRREWYEHGWCEIVIRDTGIGIKPEDLPHIFDSFRQADSSYTRGYQGTGLGLALARQFLELQGGEVLATSTPGDGAVFTIRLPADIRNIKDLSQKTA